MGRTVWSQDFRYEVLKSSPFSGFMCADLLFISHEHCRSLSKILELKEAYLLSGEILSCFLHASSFLMVSFLGGEGRLTDGWVVLRQMLK
jgi:hypothetical protein